MTNEELIDKISEDIPEYCDKKSYCEGALRVAKFKDDALKEFLLLHIDIPYTGEYGEDGSPLALDYIEWMEEKNKKAQEIFEKFKEYENKFPV